MKKILQILSFTVFAAWLTACDSQDEKEIKTNTTTFVEAIINGNFDTALALSYSNGKKANDSEREQGKILFMVMQQSLHQEVEKRGGLKSVEVTDIKINSDKNQATAKMVIKMSKAKTKPKLINLYKEDGKWKVEIK